MGRLNSPREIPYDFRYFEADGLVYLFDDSERTYACSAQPLVYLAAVFDVTEAKSVTTSDYNSLWAERGMPPGERHEVRLPPEAVAASVNKATAWAAAEAWVVSQFLAPF
jgi:hypothetical protein